MYTFIKSAGILIDEAHGCGGISCWPMEDVEDISVRLVASKITETDELYISRLTEQPSTTNHGELCVACVLTSLPRKR